MRWRSIFGKSAAVACSLVLVSVYIYQRSGGELFSSAPRESPKPSASHAIIHGTKSAPVLFESDSKRDGSSAAAADEPAKPANDSSVKMMPGPKSAFIFQPVPTEALLRDIGETARASGGHSQQDSTSGRHQ
jgi:hypothetical protein